MEKHSNTSVFGRKSRAKLFPLIGLENNKPIGVAPIFYYETPVIRYVFSPPVSTGVTYQGPLIADYYNLKQRQKEFYSVAFVKKIDEFISKELKPNVLKIRTAPNQPDCRSFTWGGYKTKAMYNYEIDLSMGLDNIWGGFPEKLKKSIRKTQSANMTIEEGSKEDLIAIISDTKKRYSEQSLESNMSIKYVSDLYDVFYPDNLRIFSVRNGKEHVGGCAAFSYNKRFIGWVGMSKTGGKGIYPNDLLMWETIKWASTNGYEVLEITWANTQHLCKYKAKFNPKPAIYFSCEKYSPLVKGMYLVKEGLIKTNIG